MERETAMKILKELHGKSLFAERTALETLIPELADSNDERIRKCLIEFFEDWHENKSHCWDIAVTAILAWLEKQGEQKPTSNTRYKVSAGGSLIVVNGKPFDYEKATITQKDFASKQEPKKIEDEIEIPFGAKDSELIEERYYIPKGCYVEVRDGYVAIKKGEKSAAWSDEDEKMYKIAFSCIETLEDISNGKNMHADVKEWLKSIKNRIGG